MKDIAEALKTLKPGLLPEKEKEFGPSKYFSELPLLKGKPRTVTIVAVSILSPLLLKDAFSNE